jgi:hypothetical protein
MGLIGKFQICLASPKGIECNGEVIPLTPENGERIAAAVASLKGSPGAKSEPVFQDRLAALDAAGDRLLEKFQALAKTRGRSDPYITRDLEDLRRKVVRLISDVE